MTKGVQLKSKDARAANKKAEKEAKKTNKIRAAAGLPTIKKK